MTERIPTLDPRVDRVRAEQYASWERGERVLLEAYLLREPTLADDPDALLDLLYSEVLLREEKGERPEAGEYLARFPQLADAIRRQFVVHDALTAVNEPGHETQDGSATGGMGGPASAPLPPGDIGSYELLGEIGRGAMGVVYKARHRLLPTRLVALKVIRPGSGAGEERARFQTEARAIAGLRHEHIVPIYEYGLHVRANGEEVPFVALEYVEGGNLAQALAGTPLSPRQAAELLAPLADAVHHAHAQGVIHRDLKPANVLLCRKSETRNPKSATEESARASDFEFRISDFSPKVSDFGLAKQLGEDSGQTRTGAVMGTPSYMAPEQAQGRNQEVGPGVDVYALGAILYELLTGRPPFKGDSVLATLQQVAQLEPVSPHVLNPSVPADLETICLKCLQKEPRARYAAAGSLADDLRRFLEGRPIQARPVSGWEKAVKWMKRRPAASALVAVSLLGVLGALVAWVLFTAELRAKEEYARGQTTLAEARLKEAQEKTKEAQEKTKEAQHESERATRILSLTVGALDKIATDLRSAKTEELETGNTGGVLYEVACSFARTSAVLADDPTLEIKDRKQLADQYATSAVKLLLCAQKVGFFTRSDNRKRLQTNGDLLRLKEHPNFALLNRVLDEK
jgi:serine/threonine protein kinase